jgi:alkylhydroperoxidase/carboxymuconolactone decarboxylase family protein YurZ
MSDASELPLTYRRFADRFPAVVDAHSALGAATEDAGPLDDRTRSLIKLGICLGAGLESAARSHTRRALEAGATREELEHAVVLGVGTVGFSRAVMTWAWIQEEFQD